MQKILIATKNEGKMKEFRRMLEPLGYEVVSAASEGITEDVEETGTTFLENAILKAVSVCKASGMPSIGDDSGLCVDALGGDPGVYTARYAGPEKNNEKNIQKLLDNLKDVPDEQRGAHFEVALACAFPDGKILKAVGQCYGTILHAKQGEDGFGYDPIFSVDGKSFAEISREEKDKISHRGKALRRLLELMKEDKDL